MAVRELLRAKPSEVITINAEADLAEAAKVLMDRNIGGLPVVDGEEALVGFLAERDIVAAVHRHPDGARNVEVRRAMRRPAPACRADDRLQAVMARMTRERLRHLVVEDGDEIVGVISVGDLVKHRLEQLETEAGVLRDYVAAQRARG